MTSADFYESWVSHEEETEAVSCYYHISGKKVALNVGSHKYYLSTGPLHRNIILKNY